MKALITTVLLCASLGVAAAQTQAPASAPADKGSNTPKRSATAKRTAPVAGRSECALAVGLCVIVPAPWQRLGDIFDNLGFVVAEPHPGTDSATWPQLTVAAIDVPPQKDSNGAAATAPSLDALVDIVLTPDGSFTSSETLRRTHLILNGGDAEIVRVRLHDDVSKSEAIEEIALIEGNEGLVYSIALRCTPQEFARLEPVFQKAAHSWRIKEVAADPAPQSKPKQDSEKK
jgi:hypothetical protein